jgi:hypothetical protein
MTNEEHEMQHAEEMREVYARSSEIRTLQNVRNNELPQIV